VVEAMTPERPRVGVIALVWQGARVLLVRRKFSPLAGYWGFPGGKLELGEPLLEAAARELHEETGVTARPLEVLTALDMIEPAAEGGIALHYVLVAVRAQYVAGEVQAADDADAAAWFQPQALPAPLCPQVRELAERYRP
jgi:8-oxo-dGTP diphosphatase